MKITQRQLMIVGLALGLCGYIYAHLNGEKQGQLSLASFEARKLALPKVRVADKRKTELEMIKIADPALKKKWGLKLIDSLKAFKTHKVIGSKNIVVAVIDTGLDVHHEDLKNNLWLNTGETGIDSEGRNKASNGKDDDGNGYIDDIHGWNFVSDNNDLKDNHGHGTHISGIIGAEGGNKVGISGVAPKVSLMVLKYYDPKAHNHNNLMNTVKAIEYAIKMNAHIINYSGGGLEQSFPEKNAIAKARRKGVLFVAAAGNERSNSDEKGYYPADYDLKNILSVTAIDKGKNVLPTSNYGVKTVDIAAPGNNIYSTLPGDKYGHMTGTSQATAFVTGVAVLLMSKYTHLRSNPRLLARHLNNTGDIDSKLIGKTQYRRRLNTYRALSILDQGMGVTGVIAHNTNNMDKKQFASTDGPRDSSFKLLGKSIKAVALKRYQKKRSKVKQVQIKNKDDNSTL